MRFRHPAEDNLASASGLKMMLFIVFPVGLIAAIVRGDAPAWFYIAWTLGAVCVVMFTFVLLPNYQDWFAGKDLRADNRDV
jgi:hypothetical protein